MPGHSSATGIELHEAKRQKEPVRAASTGTVTLALPGATLDGVALVSGDRVLLKDQTAGTDNGIYTWSGAASLLVRTADTDAAADFTHGFLVFVREGTTNGATFWAYTTATTPIVLGSTNITFTAFSGIGATGATGAPGAPGAPGVTGAPGPPGILTVTGAPPYICIQDQKASGTNGGTFTSGADRTRDLNTFVANDLNLATLASNQVTLPAGTYRYHISAPASVVDMMQALLYNVTAGATIQRGTSVRSGTVAASFVSTISGRTAFRQTTVLEVRHRCQTTRSTDGFGVSASFGTEVYTVAEFWFEAGPPPFYGPGSAVLDMPIRRPWMPLPREGTIEHSLDTTP